MADETKFIYYVVYWDRLAQGEHLNAMQVTTNHPIEAYADVLSLRGNAVPDDDFDIDDIVIISWVRLQ
jgi:hypothetical protein